MYRSLDIPRQIEYLVYRMGCYSAEPVIKWPDSLEPSPGTMPVCRWSPHSFSYTSILWLSSYWHHGNLSKMCPTKPTYCCTINHTQSHMAFKNCHDRSLNLLPPDKRVGTLTIQPIQLALITRIYYFDFKTPKMLADFCHLFCFFQELTSLQVITMTSCSVSNSLGARCLKILNIGW